MSIKVNVDAGKALENIGFSTAPLVENSISLVPFTGGVKFVKGGEVLSTWACAPAKVAEIAQNGFDEKSAMHVTAKGNADTAYAQALSAVGKEPTKGTTGKVTATAKAAKAKVTVAPAGPVPLFPLDKMKTAPLVKLITATQLYQPVSSTSQGSRYYVVGMSNGVKVAARIKSNTISVRIEGTSFAAISPTLTAAGFFGPEFGGSFSDNYASMHVQIANIFDAQKVVGSVIGILHEHIKHPVPDLKPLEAA